MAVREVQLVNDSVKARTIAKDTIVAADIGAGAVDTSELADQGVSGAKASTAAFILLGRDNTAHTSSSLVEFSTEMTAIPKVYLSLVGADVSGTTVGVVSASTAGFNYNASHESTLDWLAVANVEAQSLA